MWQLLSRMPKQSYALVEDGSSGSSSPLHNRPRQISLLYIATTLLVGVVSFLFGKYSVQLNNPKNQTIKCQYMPCNLLKLIIYQHVRPTVNTISEIFRYNRTFSSGPSNITNQAWTQLFPNEGGFFKHPVIAPKRSTFAVFHQLHCLVCI